MSGRMLSLSASALFFSGSHAALREEEPMRQFANSRGVDVSMTNQCVGGTCYPGREFCGAPFQNAPGFHLMDQHGCGENDPNGPVFDPVHGVIHHFYQIHLAATPGHGPDYGHFVSKDFVHWAALPVAIWNGLDSSVWPPKETPYDNEAIFTGSAVLVDGAGPGGKKGIVNIYPGLCNKNDWPGCETGTLLAQAVPADYANDPLLTNWTKPSYNPIMENTQRDPSSPWKTSSGEWRLRTYESKIYGSASDADMLAGKWYLIGENADWRACECPSFYPLPASTPGFEAAYSNLLRAGSLPTHVHKTSCGGDFWQLGTYDEGAPNTTGSFKATSGWEDLFAQKRIDQGPFYASKDNEYPTKAGGKRRINWGWSIVGPASVQSLPREITFNAALRTLQQYPIEELKSLRGAAIEHKKTQLIAGEGIGLSVQKTARQSEILVSFELPAEAATFGITISSATPNPPKQVTRMMLKTDLPGGDYNVTHHPANTDPSVCQAICDKDDKCRAWTYVIRGQPAGSGDCVLKSVVPCPGDSALSTSGSKQALVPKQCGDPTSVSCTVDYKPPAKDDTYYNVTARVGAGCLVPGAGACISDVLRLLPSEKTVEIRIFADQTFIEAFFQQGRVAFTNGLKLDDTSDVSLFSTTALMVGSTDVYPMNGIWVSPEEILKAPRVYNDDDDEITVVV